MNKIWLNIAAVLLLSGCSMFNKNPRTDSKGETINKNAPVFITPKANVPAVNKPSMNEVSSNKPPQVIFNADKYVMVKEKDLNLIVDQKTNEILLNIKKSNASAPQPNKELDAAIDSHIKKSIESPSVSLTPNVLQLVPVEQEKASSSHPAIHPVFAYILTTLAILSLILALGYFFFIKRKCRHENACCPCPTPAAATASSETTKVATQAETQVEHPEKAITPHSRD